MIREKVQIWILRPNHECLILKTVASRGGFWQPVTGSIEPGELAVDAAAREALEETGLKLERPRFTGRCFEFQSQYGHLAREYIFEAQVADSNSRVKLSHEHCEFEWLPLETARQRLKFPA